MFLFGNFKGMPHDIEKENFEDYKNMKNMLDKSKVISHIKTLEIWRTSTNSLDMFTGKELESGMLYDGDFGFPFEFLYYYENYDIGIPPKYEEYLKTLFSE